MDQRALWLSSAFAAARLAVALWCGQLALSTLDRRRATLGWQITLAAIGVGASSWALRATAAQAWWREAWVINGLLSAAILIDCVRRWISTSSGELVGGRIHFLVAACGLAVSVVATATAIVIQLPHSWYPRIASTVQMAVSAAMLGTATAVSFELTLGALGAALLKLRWRPLARAMALCWAVQLVISILIMAYPSQADTPLETATPVLYALGMTVVGYIVWSIPQRLVSLTAKGTMEGQASLAVAGWLAVICLTIACALPRTWPWSQVAQPASADVAAFAIVEQQGATSHALQSG